MSEDISIRKYQAWFGRYARRFLKDAGRDTSAVGLKIVHSQRVRHEIVAIGKAAGLNPGELLIAEVTGLFHDIGRFEQFLKFHTFVDAVSVDHAKMSRQVLEKEGVLNDFTAENRSIILDAVYYHNKLAIPSSFDGRREMISRLIRDADKLDILRVFDERYKKGAGSEAVNLGLPGSKNISSKVLVDFLHERVVNFMDVRSTTDFLVMRLSWFYDINFPQTLRRIKERGYLETMGQHIPRGALRAKILEKIDLYVEKRMDRNAVLWQPCPECEL